MSAADGNSKVKVTFANTRDSRKREMEVGPAVTAKKAIEGLASLNFIDAPTAQRQYVLSIERTGKQIPLSETLSSAGVAEGDVVVVTETNVGAAGGLS